MQEVASEFILRWRPIRFFVVLVLSHDKNADGLARSGPFDGKLVLDTFEEIVVPGNQDIGRRKFDRLIAKFDVADVAPEAGMPADLHKQTLAVTCRFCAAVRLDSHVIPECAG